MWINFRYRNWGEKARNTERAACVRASINAKTIPSFILHTSSFCTHLLCVSRSIFTINLAMASTYMASDHMQFRDNIRTSTSCVYLNIKSGESGGSWQVRHAQITWMLTFGFGASNCSVSLQKNNWETLWRPSQHIVCPRVLLTTITSEFQRVLEPSSNERNMKRKSSLSVHCLKFTGKKLLTWATSIGEGGVCLKNWA